MGTAARCGSVPPPPASEGCKHDIAKPLKGFGSGVFEVALKYRTDAYRTVYALQNGHDVLVLHAFQKKAK